MTINCDFSYTHYEAILETALEQDYAFIGYNDLDTTPERVCVLRHDMDYTPARALDLAKIEQRLGIQAHYFFLINTSPYNLLEKKTYEAIQEIHAMGHTLGLHFDVSWKEGMQWEEIPEQCNHEKALFKQMTGIEPCEVVSFHNPHTFTERILNKEVPGIEHTYEKRYFSDIKYLSDSQGWYEGCMCGIFKNATYSRIHLLTHPYIWGNHPLDDFTEDMAQMIQDKTEDLVQYLIKYHPVCAKNQDRLRALTRFETKLPSGERI